VFSLAKLRSIYAEEALFPTWLGLFVNPFYFARKGLTRHIKIKAEANPYDPVWDDYFETRNTRKWFCSKWGRSKLRRLWWQQNGLCPVCQQKFKGETSIHVHTHCGTVQGGW